MVYLMVLIHSLIPARYASIPVTVDSVTIDFTLEKSVANSVSGTSFYYRVSLENSSSTSKYVIIPKQMGLNPPVNGVMKNFDDLSHDEIHEYAIFTDSWFVAIPIGPKEKIIDEHFMLGSLQQLKEQHTIEIPVYVTKNLKIGQLELKDYLKGKDFYGVNLPYKMIGASIGKETLALE